jgi:hypothetical protein
MQSIGLVGIWGEKPLLNGLEIKKALPRLPVGPVFREVMKEQEIGWHCIPVLERTSW